MYSVGEASLDDVNKVKYELDQQKKICIDLEHKINDQEGIF
jgi:hypothetical protein